MEGPPDELVVRAVNGDTAVLTDLLRYFGPRVRRKLDVGARWRSALDADDVMQVTYLEAALSIGQFSKRTSAAFESWLTRIATNNLRDAIRELSRIKRPQTKNCASRSIAGNRDKIISSVLDASNAAPSRHAARREAAALLNTAISKLPEDYRLVVRLYDLAGNSAAEIGRELHRTEGAVFMLRARAHDRLRQILGSDSLFFTKRA